MIARKPGAPFLLRAFNHATGFHDHDTPAVLRHCSPAPPGRPGDRMGTRHALRRFGAPAGGGNPVSRRMGPGGRLRPAPRSHRTPVRPESDRPPGFPGAGAPEGAIGDTSAEMVGLAGSDVLAPESRPLGVLPRRRALPANQPAEGDLPPALIRPRAGDIEPALVGGELSAGLAEPRDPAGGRPEPVDAPLAGQPFEDEQSPARPSRAHSYDRRPPLRGPAPGLETAPPAPRPVLVAQERPAPNCTTPQLRRFIKSRAYVPMHELRRRFAIEGGDDDVSPIDLASGRIFAGLPGAAAQLLGDLVRAGDVGYELSMDPRTPVIVGVYAMRPVTRS